MSLFPIANTLRQRRNSAPQDFRPNHAVIPAPLTAATLEPHLMDGSPALLPGPAPSQIHQQLSASRRGVARRIVEKFDPDQLIDVIPGGHVEHRLLAQGPFQVRAVHLERRTFRLDYLRYSAGVALKGELPHGCVGIAFALRMPGDMVAYGIPHHALNLLHLDATTEFDIRLPAGGEWVVLRIEAATFESEILARCGDVARARGLERLPLTIPDPQRRRLASLLRNLADTASAPPWGVPGFIAMDNLDEDAIAAAFIDAYVAARPPALKGCGTLARRHRLVSRAEEYTYAHIDDSIRMRQLCRDVGASARTLEYAFKGVYGVGTMESLRTLRLNEVRKRLLRARGGTTVTAAAMDWGFWHLGEFAAAYKRLFGELPSDTLRAPA